MWTLIVEFAEPIVGDEISEPFTGNIGFNAVSAVATRRYPTTRAPTWRRARR